MTKDEKDREPDLPEDAVRWLRELIQLREEYSAKGDGKVSGPRKDLAAHRALSTIASITTHYAAWALFHQVGKANAGIDWFDRGINWIGHESASNSHEWELSGNAIYLERPWKIEADSPMLQPHVQRAILWNILASLRYIFPEGLQYILRESFDLALHGAPSPLFSITTTNRSYERRRLQLEAIGHRAYRGKGGEEKVADAFGVEVETLNGWATVLRNDENFGPQRVDQEIKTAEYIAVKDREVRENPPDKMHRSIDIYADKYLERVGEAWQAL